ncbi:MAG: RDD family protein [Solirubrobacteraceae bacterium]|nr:RDD family protein [Patulibacter sp.]
MSAGAGDAAGSAAEPVFVRPGDARVAGVAADPGPRRWRVAQLRRRAQAWFVDFVLIGVLEVLAMLPVWALDDRASPFGDHAGLFASIHHSSTRSDLLVTTLADVLALAIWIAYDGFLLSRRGAHCGQTLGKQLFGVRIRRADGASIDRRAAWRRAALLPTVLIAPSVLGNLLDAVLGTQPTLSITADVSEMVVIGGLFATALLSDDRRHLVDRGAGTVVVEELPAGVPEAGEDGTVQATLPVEGRERTSETWWLAGFMAFLLVANAISSLKP